MESLKIDMMDYDYDLPNGQIAEYPLEDRASAKMLKIEAKSGKMQHHKFSDIKDILPDDSLLVLNSTKVIFARIFVSKPTGGRAELLLVEPVTPSNDPQIVMNQTGLCIWECIVGGRKINDGLILRDDKHLLNAEIIRRKNNEALVKFTWNDRETFAEILSKTGKVPLPPYIKRESEESDKNSYQTVYAREEGSVAAPTAGLHFTDDILKDIREKNIQTSELVLHVGPGTFMPVESDDIFNHSMHSEQFLVAKSCLKKIHEALKEGKKITATGTTSVRTLESLYWLGVKYINHPTPKNSGLELGQWEPYAMAQKGDLPPADKVIKYFLDSMRKTKSDTIYGRTSLFIIPGYEFKIVNNLITNFHLPKSTLVLLVSAFMGKELWKKSYDEALKEGYRFLSYGDTSFIEG
jgi:S-adenosylmethionine:tRNA ribosyltransferase-isomerase